MIGIDGFGLITYYDSTDGDLQIFHCLNVACTSGAGQTLDLGATVGAYTSITMGSDGLGLISYRSVTTGNLKVAHCSDAYCAALDASAIFGSVGTGFYTSITVGG